MCVLYEYNTWPGIKGVWSLILCFVLLPLVMCELLFFSIFAGLSWNDTKTTRVFTNLAGLLIIRVHTIPVAEVENCIPGVYIRQIPEQSLVPHTLAPDVIEQLFL